MTLRRRLALRVLRSVRREGISSRVYELLVAEIFKSLPGYLMLSAAGLIFVVYALAQTRTAFWGAVALAMVVVTAGRLLIFRRYRRAAASGRLRKPSDTAGFELALAALAVMMSSLVGLGIYCFATSDQIGDVVCALILSMGIAGGVSGRNGSRPKIALAQVCTIIAPLILALASGSPAFRTVSCTLLIIFMLATHLSITSFYQSLKTSFEAEASVRSLAQRLEASRNLFKVALDNMTSGLIFFDRDKKALIANERVREMLGQKLIDGIIGRTTVEFHADFFRQLGMSDEEGRLLRERFVGIIAGSSEGRCVMRDHTRNRTFELKIVPIAGQGAVLSVDDVTEKHQREQEIHRLAHYDTLTGLPNRFTFETELQRRLNDADGREIVVCYLDLDCFKAVNDANGHHDGDQLLRFVAERIDRGRRACDFAGRLAGDEFALILDLADGPAAAEAVVAAILTAIAAKVQLARRVVKVGASAGMVRSREAGYGAEAAMRFADRALYEAKKAGGGTALWYDRHMDVRARQQGYLTAMLDEALHGEQLTLVYQPIVDFRAGTMVACEALARWNHPELGEITPGRFIPLAEQSGLIHRLGQWALLRACQDIKAWGEAAVKVAVNVSPLQFEDGAVCDVVAAALSATGIAPDMLEIEITESAIASDPAAMKAALHRLNAMGVSIALDDFGTGYSSLSLLHDLPIAKIKLDRSFVTAIKTDPTSVRLIASIVQMSQVMHKQLVVEGVETHGELLAIAEAQARFVQGYYFCRPVPLEDLKTLRFASFDRGGRAPGLVPAATRSVSG